MKIMIDMFAGLGGASEAMIRDEDWLVWRLDNNILLEDVQNMQITNSMFELLKHYKNIHSSRSPIDLIWASPPCTDFSHGFHSKISKSRRNEKGFENFIPSTKLVEKTYQTIKNMNPKFWVIENVIGSIKWLEPILGQPTQIIGSQVLWGNFPFINMPPGFKENKEDKDKGPNNKLRANYRAIVPFEISMCLKIAIIEQRTLLEWC